MVYRIYFGSPNSGWQKSHLVTTPWLTPPQCFAPPCFWVMLRRRLPRPPKPPPMLLAGCPECTGRTIPIYHSHRLNWFDARPPYGRPGRALLERHRHPLDKPLSTLVAPDSGRQHPFFAPDPISVCPRLVWARRLQPGSARPAVTAGVPQSWGCCVRRVQMHHSPSSEKLSHWKPRLPDWPGRWSRSARAAGKPISARI